MKISKITISNYKSFNSDTIDAFTKINMIYGHNNSGKSNLLKLISLIFERKLPSSAKTTIDESRNVGEVKQLSLEKSSDFWNGIIANQPFIFREGAEKLIKFDIVVIEKIENLKNIISFDSLKEIYFNQAGKNSVTISISGEIKPLGDYDAIVSLTKVLLENIEIFLKDIPDKYFDSAKGAKAEDIKSSGYEILNSLLGTFNDSVLLLDNDRYFVDEKEINDVKELTSKTFKNWFHNASLNPLRYDLLKKIVQDVSTFRPNGDANFTDNEKNSPIHNGLQIEFARLLNNLNIFLTNKKNLRLPLSNYGTGVQQILFILSKIAEKNPRIVLIEEIELNLSPKYQYELLQHFLLKLIEPIDKPLSQVFFTTHTPMLCFRDDFQIHKISINENGESKAERIGDRKSIKTFYPAETIKLLIEQ